MILFRKLLLKSVQLQVILTLNAIVCGFCIFLPLFYESYKLISPYQFNLFLYTLLGLIFVALIFSVDYIEWPREKFNIQFFSFATIFSIATYFLVDHYTEDSASISIWYYIPICFLIAFGLMVIVSFLRPDQLKPDDI